MQGKAKRENKFPPLQSCWDNIVCCLHSYTKQNNKIFVQTFRCAVALWKSWLSKYSIRFQVIKLKLLCKTLKNEKWKILAWYPNKIRRYRQQNPKYGDWRWKNFQTQVVLSKGSTEIFYLLNISTICFIIKLLQTKQTNKKKELKTILCYKY